MPAQANTGHMTPGDDLDFCRALAAPPGSNLHYACLYVAAGERRRLYVLHAAARMLEESVTDSDDPGVARLRLQWWGERLHRGEHVDSDHPLLRAWAGLDAGERPTARELDAMLAGREALLAPAQPGDFHQLLLRHRDTGGALWRWSLPAGETPDAATLAAAEALGCAVEVLRALQRLHRDARRGRLWLPADLLAACGAEAERLRPGHAGPGEARLQQALVEALHRHVRDVQRHFDTDTDRRHLPCRIMLRLLEATCTEIARDGYRLTEHRLALTPLRKLWLAWRTRRG